MLSKFSTKDLVFASLVGALMFVLSFMFGSVLNVATGNPAASGFASTFIQAIIMTVAVLIIKKFGIVTIMWLIYGVLAIPTNMLGSLPGVLKIVLAFGIGFIFDLVVWIGKYRKGSLFAGFIAMYAVLVPITIWFYVSLGVPGADKVIKAAPYLFAIFLVESFIGIFIGLYIFRKIKDKVIVRQLQA